MIFQIGITVGILLIIFGNQFGRLLINRRVGVKRVSQNRVIQTGDVFWDGNVLHVKFFWSVKKFSLLELNEISGFSGDDFSAEYSNEFVEVRFGKRTSIVFNANTDSHILLLNCFIKDLGFAPINWSEASWSGTENEPVVFYKR